MSELTEAILDEPARITSDEFEAIDTLRQCIGKAELTIPVDHVTMIVPARILSALDVVLLVGLSKIEMDFE